MLKELTRTVSHLPFERQSNNGVDLVSVIIIKIMMVGTNRFRFGVTCQKVVMQGYEG